MGAAPRYVAQITEALVPEVCCGGGVYHTVGLDNHYVSNVRCVEKTLN